MPTPPKNPNEAFEAYDRIRRQRSLTVDSATEVAQRFGFHKATIEGPEATQPKHVLLRRAFMLFAQDLYALLPEGHYRGLAVDLGTNLARLDIMIGNHRPAAREQVGHVLRQ